MERRKSYDTIEFIHEATVGDETEVIIKLGNGFEIKTKMPFDVYAEQRLGKYKKVI